MGTLTEYMGDLFASDAPALAQGVNVDGVMGAGIAVAFRRRFPGLYEDYRAACQSGRLEAGGLHTWRDPQSGVIVFNMASQDRPGANARLEWVDSSARAALRSAEQMGVDRIALPRIASGIGGLQWVDVRAALTSAAADSSTSFEVWVN